MNTAKEQGEHDFLYKVVLIGDSAVGKSNILSRFTKNQFNPESKTTIGVEFATKNVTHLDKKIKLQVWDTAGQERYRSMASAYYRGASGAFLVYDITRLSTFENIEKWLKQLKNYSEQQIVTMLIGNKSDQRQFRAVKSQQGQEFAKKHNMLFLQTSAFDASNIQQSFQVIVQEISGKEKTRPVQKEKVTLNRVSMDQVLVDNQNKKKCC